MKDVTDDVARIVEERILHILECFPKISPSMLQISLGSGIPTSLWHNILQKLIDEKRAFRYQVERVSPTGRHQMQTVIARYAPNASEDVVDYLGTEDIDLDAQ